MPITIQGIRIESIDAKFVDGKPTISAHYSILSGTGKVFAKQEANGYQKDVEVQPSAQCQKALEAFVDMFKKEIEILLGLDVHTT